MAKARTAAQWRECGGTSMPQFSRASAPLRPAGRPRPSKYGADRRQCAFRVLVRDAGRWVA